MSNEKICMVLKKLNSQYNNDYKLKFKARAIKKAISSIEDYDEIITSGDYAKKNVSFIGPGIAKRIDEILKTGTLKELNNNNQNILNEFKKITGVGNSRANSWIKSVRYW